MTSALPDRGVLALADELASMKARIDAVESGIRADQLGNSSIEDNYLAIYDKTGVLRARIGRQDDGTFVGGISSNNAVAPPVPKAPTVVGILAGLRITGNGPVQGDWPADFARYNVYTAASGVPATVVGTLLSDDDVFVHPLLAGTSESVWLTAVNLSGTESAASEIVPGTANRVVSTDLLNGAVGELALAAQAVSEAKLAAAAVTETKVAEGAIHTPHFVAGAVDTAALATDAVAAGTVAADAITAREVLAASLTGDTLAANTITGGHLQAGSIGAALLEADLVLATRLIVGTADGDRLEIHPVAGLQGFKAGVQTLHFDVGTGNMTAVGKWSTNTGGERLVIDTDGTLRFYDSNNNVCGVLDNVGTGGVGGVRLSGGTYGSRGNLSVTADIAHLSWGNMGAPTTNAAVAAFKDFATVRAPLVMVQIDRRFGTPQYVPQFFIQQMQSDGSSYPSDIALLQGGATGSLPGATDEQIIWWTGSDVGLSNSDYYGGLWVRDWDNYGMNIVAAAFNPPSGKKRKANIRPFEPGTTPDTGDERLFAAFAQAPARRWRYKQPGDPIDPDDPTQGVLPDIRPPRWPRRKPNPALSAAEFAALPDDDPRKWVDDTPPPRGPRTEPDHLFPIAEDLLTTAPELITTAGNGELLVDLRDAIGWLWAASGRLHARVVELEKGPKP